MTVKLSTEAVAALDEVCRDEGLTQTEALERAILDFADSFPKKIVVKSWPELLKLAQEVKDRNAS